VPFELKHEPVTTMERNLDSRLDSFRVAVEGLPRAQKELILLLAENDWSYEQLAEITNSTVSSVKSRLFRAREFLRGRETDED
jgi:RNA polymerase sigma-70 factor, ECF subfamily